MLANRLLVLPNGSWGLPFWSEPFNSYLEYPAYHPLKELPPKPAVKRPYRSDEESRQGEASLLVTNDKGLTWETFGNIQHKETWLIENPVVCVEGEEDDDEEGGEGEGEISKSKSLLMLFRTGLGEIYFSTSKGLGDDNKRFGPWSDATPLRPSMPNPNSKICCITAYMSGLDKQRPVSVLVLAYNNSTIERSPLDIALSFDSGKTFLHIAVLDCEGPRNFAYPDVLYWEIDVIKVSYSYWTKGLRLATLNIKEALKEAHPETYQKLL